MRVIGCCLELSLLADIISPRSKELVLLFKISSNSVKFNCESFS